MTLRSQRVTSSVNAISVALLLLRAVRAAINIPIQNITLSKTFDASRRVATRVLLHLFFFVVNACTQQQRRWSHSSSHA